MLKSFITICIFFIANNIVAQRISTQSATESLLIAQKYINQQKYDYAKAQLYETIRLKKDFAVAYRELGKIHLELNEYEDAANILEKSFELDKNLSRVAYFECGDAYFKMGEFEKASSYFKKYRDLENTPFTNTKKESGLEQLYNFLQPIRMKSCAFASRAIAMPVAQLPKLLNKKINTKKDEYLPALNGDGNQLLFTRKKRGDYTDENIYVSSFRNLEWQKPKSLGDVLNTPMNEGMAKFTADESEIYFTGCFREDTEGNCDIYKGIYKAKKVPEVHKLMGSINSNNWDSQPAISCEGTTLYFSSTRPGGYGGSDIWYSKKLKNGDWGEAINMGLIINTPGDEESPFIAMDDRSLYFTSNGHLGMGDGDIFLTKLVGDTWTKPKNLGYPINTQFKEVGFFVDATNKTAFFSSERPGGQGGLDIYKIDITKSIRPAPTKLVRLQVVNAVSKEQIKTALTIRGLKFDKTLLTNKNGEATICLKADKGYVIQAQPNGYEYYIHDFFASKGGAPVIYVDIALNPRNVKSFSTTRPTPLLPKKILAKNFNIYFGSNESNLNSDNKEILEDILFMLSENSLWTIEIIGYSDNIGNQLDNQKLSQRRAMAVFKYLNSAGARIRKMHYEGKGSTNSGALTENERQMSRKVEIILKKTIN